MSSRTNTVAATRNNVETVPLSRKLLPIALVLLIYLFAVLLRIHCFDTWWQGSFFPFISESAAHFRYASMVDQGVPVPGLDIAAQYPEGLEVFNKTSICEEYVVGWLHRILLHGMDFQTFIHRFIPIFHSLTIIPLFLLTLHLTRDRLSSILAVLVYATAWPAIARTSGHAFSREMFALPWIFAHLAAMGIALENNHLIRFSGVSSLCLFIALMSWKVTQFYVGSMAAFMFFHLLFARETDSKWVVLYMLQVVAVLFAGTMVPFLRSSGFLISPTCIVLYSVTLGHLMRGVLSRSRITAIGTAVGLALILFLVVPVGREYSHVYQLLYFKLRFLGMKPDNPLLLPEDVRMFWTGPFLSPTVHRVLEEFLILIVLVGVGIVEYFRRKKRDARRHSIHHFDFLVFLSILFFVYYLFFQRMSVWVVFLFSSVVAYSFKYIRRKRGWLAALVVAGFITGFNLYQTLNSGRTFLTTMIVKMGIKLPGQSYYIPPAETAKMLRWVDENLPDSAVVLSDIGTSPSILAYTGRNTVLNSFYEDENLRMKSCEFLKALYGTIDDLDDYCVKYSVSHIVVDITMLQIDLRDSQIYTAGYREMARDSPICLLTHKARELDEWKAVYNSKWFAVFEFNGV